ncbi:hypothetical protein F350042L8_30970 [Fusobacterium ulcerans]|mgnify:CR=1 FL=1
MGLFNFYHSIFKKSLFYVVIYYFNSSIIKLIFGIFYHSADKMVHQYSKEKRYVLDGWSQITKMR